MIIQSKLTWTTAAISLTCSFADTLLADHVVTTRPAKVNIEGRVYDLQKREELAGLRSWIDSLLNSASTEEQRRGFRAAGLVGPKLCGAASVSKIENLARSAEDADLKRE